MRRQSRGHCCQDMLGMSLRSQDSESSEVDVHFQIKNPHPTPLDLVDVDFMFEDEDDATKQVVVKKVEHSYAIQGGSSKLMNVPVKLDHKEMSMVSSTMRAELNFRPTVAGIFKVSVDRVRYFLSILDETPENEVRKATGYVNGVHISSLSPTHVGFTVILRVSNGNNIPVHLEKADFTLESGEHELVKKSVVSTQSIPSKSQKRIEIALNVNFSEVTARLLPQPGEMLPFKLKMDFWFKDNTHGVYKISQEKSGAFPILAPAKLVVKEVSFERAMRGESPVAKLKLEVDNFVPGGFELSRLDYDIKLAQSGENVAELSYDGLQGVVLKEKMVLDVTMVPVEDAAFGSALWEVFSDIGTTYKAMVSIKGKSNEYGEITM